MMVFSCGAGSQEAVAKTGRTRRRLAQCRMVFAGGEALGVRKLACAFFECSICPLNSDQVKHKGGSKLPHSKARSARDRKTHCAGLGIPPVLESRSAWS